jgi:hypothetical protein
MTKEIHDTYIKNGATAFYFQTPVIYVLSSDNAL